MNEINSNYMLKKFGKFFDGTEWKYTSAEGVGLEFAGKVDENNKDAIIEFFQEFSCNPLASRRIVKDLMELGERKTTVQSSLDFVYIGLGLEELGLKMKVIPPIEEVVDSYLDSLAFEVIKGQLELEKATEHVERNYPEKKSFTFILKSRVESGFENLCNSIIFNLTIFAFNLK